jgi:hypothetical protein
MTDFDLSTSFQQLKHLGQDLAIAQSLEIIALRDIYENELRILRYEHSLQRLKYNSVFSKYKELVDSTSRPNDYTPNLKEKYNASRDQPCSSN